MRLADAYMAEKLGMTWMDATAVGRSVRLYKLASSCDG